MITELFKSFRSRHGLTQHELGLRLGFRQDVAQPRISHYETARLEVPKDVAYAFIDLAEEFGESFSLEDLYPRPLKAG